MRDGKQFRRGQILKVIGVESITSQDQLRRRLAQAGLRVTQATLSRDLRELRLVKTTEGYQALAPVAAAAPADPGLARAVREFLRDMRPASTLLVLKTPPGGAQPLAAALDGAHWGKIAGTLAGDDTVLIVTPSRSACREVRKRLEALLG
jgi:transcriptional regulator of arginine metabolism